MAMDRAMEDFRHPPTPEGTNAKPPKRPSDDEATRYLHDLLDLPPPRQKTRPTGNIYKLL